MNLAQLVVPCRTCGSRCIRTASTQDLTLRAQHETLEPLQPSEYRQARGRIEGLKNYQEGLEV